MLAGERQQRQTGAVGVERPEDRRAAVGSQLVGYFSELSAKTSASAATSSIALLIQVEVAVAVRREEHRGVVRRPHGRHVVARIERQPRADAALEVEDPEVARVLRRVEHANDHAPPVGRKLDVAVLGRVAEHAELPPGTIEPDQL